MKNKNKAFAAIAAAIGLFILTGIFAVQASAQEKYPFSNSSELEIYDNSVAPSYPSEITVSGVPMGSVVRVVVKLNNLSHDYPDDIGMLLVSPTGQKSWLFADCMSSGGGDGIQNVNLIIDENALTDIWDNPNTDIPSGSYKPYKGSTDGISQEHGDSMPFPAPVGAYPDDLSVFNGTNSPNGVWKLYVDDNSKGGSGTLAGGWTLEIYHVSVTSAPVTVQGTVKTATGTPIAGAIVKLLGPDGNPRYTTSGSFGFYSFANVVSGSQHIIQVTAGRHVFTPSIDAITPNNDPFTYDWTADPE